MGFKEVRVVRRRMIKKPAPEAGQEPEKPRTRSGARTPQGSDLFDSVEPLVARDGDVLHVVYPTVKVPLAANRYANVEVGGQRYTRQLKEGDDVAKEIATIGKLLRRYANAQAVHVIKEWNAEIEDAKGKA